VHHSALTRFVLRCARKRAETVCRNWTFHRAAATKRL